MRNCMIARVRWFMQIIRLNVKCIRPYRNTIHGDPKGIMLIALSMQSKSYYGWLKCVEVHTVIEWTCTAQSYALFI